MLAPSAASRAPSLPAKLSKYYNNSPLRPYSSNIASFLLAAAAVFVKSPNSTG